MKSITPAELKEKLFDILKDINSEENLLFITEEDEEEPIAVLVSVDEFELMLETIRFYSDPENIDLLSGKRKGEYIKWEDIDWEES